MFRRFSAVPLLLYLAIALPLAPVVGEDGASKSGDASVKILLITSGCCHDYDFQTKAMQLPFWRFF